jgi:hypothetical protein
MDISKISDRHCRCFTLGFNSVLYTEHLCDYEWRHADETHASWLAERPQCGDVDNESYAERTITDTDRPEQSLGSLYKI